MKAVNGKLLEIAGNESLTVKQYHLFKKKNGLQIVKNESFYIGGVPEKKENTFKSSVLQECSFISAYTLTDDDKQKIEKLYPNFSFKYLSEYKAKRDVHTQWEEDDLITYLSTKDNQLNFKDSFMKFVCSNTKYKNYIDSNNGIFFYDSYKDLPSTLNECEQLFDKNVLEI